MAFKLDHVVIHVSDWERSNTFYRDVLGAEIVPRGAGSARVSRSHASCASLRSPWCQPGTVESSAMRRKPPRSCTAVTGSCVGAASNSPSRRAGRSSFTTRSCARRLEAGRNRMRAPLSFHARTARSTCGP